MNIFKRLTIRKKILAGFGVMIAILALISILSINLFGKVRYFTNVDFKNAVLGMHGAMDLRINYLKTVWMVLNGTTNIDATIHDEAKASLKDGREGFRTAIGQLRGSGLVANDKLDKIDAYFNEMDRSSLNLLDLAVKKYEQMGELDTATSVTVEQGVKEGMSNADVHLLWSYVMAGNDYSMGLEKSVRDEAAALEEKVKRIKVSSSLSTFINTLMEKNRKLIKTTDEFAALLPVFNDNALRLDVTMEVIEKGSAEFEGTNKFIERASSELKTRIDNGYMIIIGVFILGGSLGVVLSLFIAKNISKPIDAMVEMTRDIAQGEGDLTKRINIDSNDELGDLAKWFNMFIDKLRQIIMKISESTDQLASASHELSASTKELLIGVKDQSEKTASVAAASEEMVASITEVASHTVKASKQAQKAESISQEGSSLAKDTVNGMNDIVNSANITAQNIEELANKASSIGDIIKVIDEIADQTNLLALNAAIEAARAGEQGRGFAVVADEVRKLAERTTKATKEVTDTIKAIQDDVSYSKNHINESLIVVQNGKSLVEKMNTSLVEMFEAVKDVQNMINHVATASDEQSTAVSDISKNIEHIDKITRTSSRGYEETALATESLNKQSEDLSGIVKMFKV